jgi:acetate kinase
MSSTNRLILTINGGSSSIKFALFETGDAPKRIFDGAIERIGLPGTTFRVKDWSLPATTSQIIANEGYKAATGTLLDWVEQTVGADALAAAGHRIVHGGPDYCRPERIGPEMLEQLHRLSPFDPEHMPEEILVVEMTQRRFPDLTQIACFDTAFHHDLPRVAQLLPIPRRFEAQGIRRYGFHGLSYQFLMQELARLSETRTVQGRIILAHLGNGASMTAVLDGKSIDTSMAFTPASGLVMSTRSGDLDPGLALYMAKYAQMPPLQFNHMIHHESGLLGVSETSPDLRDLLASENSDPRAAEAVQLFCYQAKKWIGSFAAALGGLDTLIFTGGIGENAPSIRARVCDRLEFLGIDLDEQRNLENAGIISTDAANVTVRVIRTDEELMIARSVCAALAFDNNLPASKTT